LTARLHTRSRAEIRLGRAAVLAPAG